MFDSDELTKFYGEFNPKLGSITKPNWTNGVIGLDSSLMFN